MANAAEEARDPAAHLPLGIVGSLGIATLLYLLMALCIVMMVPYSSIDIHAPFSSAFLAHGMPWAAKIVSLGALLGEVGGCGVRGGGGWVGGWVGWWPGGWGGWVGK